VDVNETILSIDPGTRVAGYALIEVYKECVKPLDFGVIRLGSGALSKRHLSLFESLEKLIERFAPTCCAVEDQFVHKNARSAITLGMARGCVLLAAARRDLPIYQYAPTQIKLACTGSGRASKDQIGQMVRMRLAIESDSIPEDAADALAIGLCHIHYRTSATPL
jgi:crossover junction endodeoxyribonuclease RuvC